MSSFVTDDATKEKKKKRKTENTDKKMKIRRDAIRFTKVVSLVGIRHATDERNSSLRRFVWLLWLVFGIGFALYQIVSQVQGYFEYRTKIETKIKVREWLPFPQVTICNENTMMPDKAEKRGITEYMKRIDEMLSTLRNASLDYETTMTELWRLVEDFHNATSDWKNLSRELAQPLKDTILKVSFDDKNLNETEFGDIMEEVVTDLGYCYAFGTKTKPLNSTREGAMNGLTVVLNANRQEFAFNSTGKPGYKILIHDPEEIPLLKESGFSLEIGMITRVSISLRNVRLKGHPYDKCNSTTESYRTSQCHAAKDYKAFIERCNCTDLYMRGNGTETDSTKNSTNYEVCSLAQIINCTHIFDNLSRRNSSIFNSSSNSSSSSISNSSSSSSDPNATEACLPQCYSPTYITSVSRSSFPLLMNEVSRIPGEAQVQNRFRVQIYYPHMSLVQADSFPAKTSIELICDISGALSLFLGATLLTLYEAMEFVVFFFKDYTRFYLRK